MSLVVSEVMPVSGSELEGDIMQVLSGIREGEAVISDLERKSWQESAFWKVSAASGTRRSKSAPRHSSNGCLLVLSLHNLLTTMQVRHGESRTSAGLAC